MVLVEAKLGLPLAETSGRLHQGSGGERCVFDNG
jgi:hypothetical protein